MALPTTATTRNPRVDNNQFLMDVFDGRQQRAMVTSFPGDPNDATLQRSNWFATPYGKTNVPGHHNNYFCISLFDDTTPLGPRRRKDLFQAAYCLVIDDVNEKIPENKIIVLPSWKLKTSPNSEQWGYIFSVPETNRHKFEALVNALVAKLTTADDEDGSGDDPGMKGVTRFVRLPVGINGKPKYANNPETELLSWHPNRKYDPEALAQAFDIDIQAAMTRFPASGGHRTTPIPGDGTDWLLKGLEELDLVLGHSAPDKVDIICPFVEDHSDRSETGTAYLPIGGFKCFHGHCVDRPPSDFVEEIAERLGDVAVARLTLDEAKNEFTYGNMFVPHNMPDDAASVPRPAKKLLANIPLPATEIIQSGDFQNMTFPVNDLWGPTPFNDGCSVMLYARSGVGKSMLALKWCKEAALARPDKRILMLDSEMAIRTIAHRMGKGAPNIDVLKIHDNAFLEYDYTGYDLVVLDTKAGAYSHTASENDVEHWGPLNLWIRDRMEAGVSTMVIHHSGKDVTRQNSGSERALQMVEVAINLIKDDETGDLKLHVDKNRQGIPDQEWNRTFDFSYDGELQVKF